MGDVIPFRPRPAAAAIPDTRTRIEGALALALDAVDQLVAALDDIDCGSADREHDADLEPDPDGEPSLGAPEGYESQIVWLKGGDKDLEAEDA